MGARALMFSSWRTSLLSTLVTVLLLLFLLGGQAGSIQALLVALPFALAGGAATLAIVRFGHLHKTRLVLFLSTWGLFTIIYTIEHQVNRGSILLSEQQIATGTSVSICPITLPFVVPTLAIRGEMIFPATLQALAYMAFFWLGMALLFGRGWCSWLCFFGGLDQACASAPKHPVIRLGRWEAQARLFPYALVIFLALVALVALYPLYCVWLCPLRLLYDPPEVTNSVAWLSAVVFVTLGMGLLIVGPLLTKKRVYCSYICPLLPVAALVGWLSPFRVKVDRSRCTDCNACVKLCPESAMTEQSLAKGGAALECSRCGKCMELCPKGAVDYKLIGTNLGARPAFVTLAVVFNVMLTSSYIMGLVQFLQTGKVPSIGGG